MLTGTKAGGLVAKKGRARRFREAREFKEGFGDPFAEDPSRTLADVPDSVLADISRTVDPEAIADETDWDEEAFSDEDGDDDSGGE